jgi:hypothetical protein
MIVTLLVIIALLLAVVASQALKKPSARAIRPSFLWALGAVLAVGLILVAFGLHQ